MVFHSYVPYNKVCIARHLRQLFRRVVCLLISMKGVIVHGLVYALPLYPTTYSGKKREEARLEEGDDAIILRPNRMSDFGRLCFSFRNPVTRFCSLTRCYVREKRTILCHHYMNVSLSVDLGCSWFCHGS
jgi:hypothetical protein